MFDEATWKIVVLVVDTGSWLHHELVLLKAEAIQTISWDERQVTVQLSREAIKSSPALDP